MEMDRRFKIIRQNYCSHKQTYVDEYQRIVTCQKCDAKLDPFEVLLSLAHEYTRYHETIEKYEKIIKELEEKYKELLRQERNAKARIRRLNKKNSEGR